ncbi:M10 family metallopeptidase C-terminal domain-containing protein [Pseudomonas sp. 18.1.10]|uniref:M10 family metallopeptidase C-terminal domain-containing protein n=1 Tax=Pseudomonas sp. 18.1.10 TaxID=2969302 RepID=UPI0021504580|nr:M10 family metallopeptidase C-terminal domain-containing protein [Pseudomonas sp. 18.1.10]MCR4539147.1 M10 family metallopeptidase C-terminal domain-containing protein [Pseudomonas sp. 18.1.10]
MNNLLKSGPDWSKPAKAPDPAPSANNATPQENPNDLAPMLTRENIKQLMRNPDSPESKALMEKTRARLTPEKIQAMVQGPKGEANAQTLKAIGKHLNNDEIDSDLAETKKQMVEEKTKELSRRNFEMLTQAFDGGSIESFVGNIKRLEDDRAAMQKQFSAANNAAKGLGDIGSSLTEDNVNKMRRDPGKTYSYNSTSESTLDAPSEIRDFTANDKLDLRGIQKQLNKPLQVVDNFSGASGEVKIDYSQSTKTSVVSVSGEPGKPPLVVKVFGEVRRENLMT